MSTVNPNPPGLYLWLYHEGWLRFGPFRHIRWRYEPDGPGLRITDENNAVVAYQDPSAGSWYSTEPRHRRPDGTTPVFQDPMVTTSPQHPYAHRFHF